MVQVIHDILLGDFLKIQRAIEPDETLHLPDIRFYGVWAVATHLHLVAYNIEESG
jgi:hypothetical protein